MLTGTASYGRVTQGVASHGKVRKDRQSDHRIRIRASWPRLTKGLTGAFPLPLATSVLTLEIDNEKQERKKPMDPYPGSEDNQGQIGGFPRNPSESEGDRVRQDC